MTKKFYRLRFALMRGVERKAKWCIHDALTNRSHVPNLPPYDRNYSFREMQHVCDWLNDRSVGYAARPS